MLIKLAAAPAPALSWEAEVLRALTPHTLKFRVPRVLGFSAPHGALAIEWIPRAPSVYAIHVKRRALPPALGRTLGKALASLHQSAPGALPPSIAAGELVQCLGWPSVAWYSKLNAACLSLLSRVQGATGGFSALVALAEAAKGAHGFVPVHGDFRHANLLMTGKNLVFVDWEMGGVSDPAVDVGSAIAEALSPMVAPRTREEQLSLSATRQWLGAFWRAYRSDAPTGRGFAERALQWAGEALLRRVYSEAHYDARFDDASERLIEAAIELLTRPTAWKRHFLGAGA